MANQLDIADAIKAIQADVTTIVRGEVELAKAELVPQVKSAGIGAGLFGAVAGGVFGLGWMLFHLLVIPLQAFIFMMLSIVYLSLSEDSH